MVNVEVDAGIAPVVKALSLFPMLKTRSSCEGNRDPSELSAGVMFIYGPTEGKVPAPWKESAAFIFDFFAPRLWAKVHDMASLSMGFSRGHTYLIRLALAPNCIDKVAEAIIAIHAEWKAQRGLP